MAAFNSSPCAGQRSSRPSLRVNTTLNTAAAAGFSHSGQQGSPISVASSPISSSTSISQGVSANPPLTSTAQPSVTGTLVGPTFPVSPIFSLPKEPGYLSQTNRRTVDILSSSCRTQGPLGASCSPSVGLCRFKARGIQSSFRLRPLALLVVTTSYGGPLFTIPCVFPFLSFLSYLSF
jgi:hypothetical protein